MFEYSLKFHENTDKILRNNAVNVANWFSNLKIRINFFF